MSIGFIVNTFDMESRTGKTTRLIDRFVQEFFNKGFVYVYEERSNDRNIHTELLHRLLDRLSLEHPNLKYIYKYGCYDGIWCFKLEKHEL